MFFTYNIFLMFAVLLLSPVILLAYICVPKFRAGFVQKMGAYRLNLKKRPTIWVHAVSVGEINAIEALVKTIRQEWPDKNIVISTVTRTGQAVANTKLQNIADAIVYFPYDFVWAINSAIKAINPSMVIIAETEIWPNFANLLAKKKIPLLIANGRISPSSYNGYKKMKPFFEQVLSKYTLILMQTKGDAQRIIDIGAPHEKTQVMGNLKFDITKDLSDEQITILKNEFKSHNTKVLIAGSTHKGEDEIVLAVFNKIKKKQPELKLLLAPRHPERLAQVEELVKKSNLNYGFRSKKDDFENNEIILLDTMGELGKLYSICDIAFIGGSFSGTGGHNPLEAMIFDKPVISGPTVFNFKDIYKYLKATKAVKVVETEIEFASELEILLNDDKKYTIASADCHKIFEQNRGAIQYVIDRMKEF